MADVESNIKVSIDTTEALAQLKALQREISAFHTSMAKNGAAGTAVSNNMQQNLLNQINAGGKFQAQLVQINSTSEAFNNALAKNQFSMKEYFRYAGAATQTFGKLFAQEHATINKVARENVKTLQTQYIKLGRDANGALQGMAVRPLTLDMQNLQTQTAMAAQKQVLFNQLLRQGSTNLLNFGKNTQWAGRQLMVGFTVPLMYFASTASKAFMQIEQQAVDFKRVYGDMWTTTADTNKALADVQKLANGFTQYGVAVADTMKLAAQVAATGKTGADLIQQVTSATKLAVLGGIDQQKSLDTVISLTSTFGVTADKLAGSIDFLNAVENQTILNINDLTTAIPKAAPVVKQLGGDVKDLAFFMTAMREGGIDAAQGANAIKSALANMINPTKSATTMLQGFGINLTAIVNGDKGNVKQMVVDLATALDKLDPLNRAQAIEKMFGKFQFARISTLFQNVIKNGSQAQTVLELSKATTEELAILSERELKKVSDSPMYKFQKQVQDLKTAIAPIGGEFLKALTPVLKFFNGIFDKFNHLGDGTKKFIVLLTTLLAGIGPLVLMSFGLLANGVANIIKLFVGVKSVFNRAGDSSKGLGEQTNFLTQQQMHNAAAAASLDQAHQKLQQRFTSEAEAVRMLTSAYEESVLAQRAFGMSALPGAVGMKPVMKYAEGVVSVPGPKGAGDIVPAMLSPGEAIIPAKMSKKYAPLISGMIAGNIPGFATGRNEFAHIGGMTTIPAAQLAAQLNEMEGAVTARAFRVINAVATKFGDALMINVYGKLGMTTGVTSTGKSINGLLGKPGGVAKSEFLADFDQQGIQRWKASLKAAGLKMENVAADLTQLDAGMKEYLTLINKDINITDSIVKEAYDYSSKKMSADNNVIVAFNQLANTAGEARINISQAVAAKFALQQVPTSGSKQVFAVGDERIRSNGDRLTFYRSLGFDIVKAAGAAIAEGAKAALKTASPSKEMRIVGEQGGEGLILGAQDTVKQAKVVGEEIGLTLSTQAGRARRGASWSGGAPGEGILTPIAGNTMVGSQSARQRGVADDIAARAAQRKAQADNNGTAASNGLTKAEMRYLGIKKNSILTDEEYAVIGRRRIATEEARLIADRELLGITEQRALTENELLLVEKLRAGQEGSKGGMSAGKLGGAFMAASMVAMIGSQMGGSIGAISQKLMMPLMAMGMIMPMLNSKMGALAVGIGLVIAAFMWLRKTYDDAQNKALALGEAMGSGTKNIIALSKAAGMVSAGEAMDRRRQNQFMPLNIQTGKSTFGQTFVQSETGKQMLKDIGSTVAAKGTAGAEKATSAQLATAVASGAMSIDQARSVAANLGQQLHDYSFGIKVNAELIKIVGMNGENLLTDPLALRVNLIENTRKDLNMYGSQSKKAYGGYAGRDFKNITGYAAAGLGAGALAGAAIGQAILPVPVVGAAVGAGVGLIAGGLIGARDRAKRVGLASGANVAEDKMALEQSSQLVDSLDMQYQKRIENAKAAGDEATAIKLQLQYEKDKAALLKEQGKLQGDILKNFKGQGKDMQKAMLGGADKAITTKYKGTAMEDVAKLAASNIGDAGMSKEKQYTLKMALASGNIDPQTMVHLMETFGKDSASMNKVMTIITKFGGKFAGQAQQVVDMMTTPTEKAQFLVDIAAKNPKEAERYLAFMGSVGAMGTIIDTKIAVDLYQKDPKIADATMAIIDKINGQKGKIDLKIATEILGAKSEALAALAQDMAYFGTLPPEQQKTFLTVLQTEFDVKGDPEQIKKFNAWLAEKGNSAKTYLDFANFQAEQVTKAGVDTSAAASLAQTPAASSGPTASPLDDVIKKLRDLRQLQIGLTTGWKASWAAMDKYFTANSKGVIKMSAGLLTNKKGEFMGLGQQLRKQNVNEQTIDFITGLSADDFKAQNGKLFKLQKDGSIKMLVEGKKLNMALNAIAVGNFENAQEKILKSVQNQSVGFTKLTALGYTTAEAYSALSDAEFAAAVASGTMTAADIKAAMAKARLATETQKQADQQKAANEYLTKVKDALDNEAAYTKLASTLNSMGYATDQIATILGDDNLAQGFIAKLKAGKLDAQGIADSLKQLQQTQIQHTSTQLASGDFAGAFQPGYDAANRLFDIKSRMLDMEYRGILKNDQTAIDGAQAQVDAEQTLIDAKNQQINVQQKVIDAAQAEVDVANQLIQVQNDRNDKLSHDLKLMDHAAQAINDKYDKQKTALENIANLNSQIAAQEQKRVTLADALTQGDISAAAKAALDMRATDAANAIGNQSKGLDAARQLELDRLVNDEGKTRLQIEAEQYTISENIYTIQQTTLKNAQSHLDTANATLKTLQDQLTSLNDELDSRNKILDTANKKLDADNKALATAKENIKVLGQTKQEWDDMKLKIDAAQAANDKTMKASLAGALATGKIVEGTWGAIVDALNAYLGADGSEITTKEIHEIINQIVTQFTTSGTPPSTPSTPSTPTQDNAPTIGESRYIGSSMMTWDGTNWIDKAVYDARPKVGEKRYIGSMLMMWDGNNWVDPNSTPTPTPTPTPSVSNKGVRGALLESMGGLIPKYFASGGFAMKAVGADTIPAMLTPGEFVVTKYGVQNFGVDNLRAINAGSKNVGGDSVYTYNLSVNVKSDANPDEIARTVISQIRQIDNQRIRGNKI
jgi:hypothetical protein